MTTIAFRDGVLAADTLVTSETYREANMLVQKVIRLGLRSAVAISGETAETHKMLAWLKTDRTSPRPQLHSDIGLVEVTDGAVTIHEQHGDYPIAAYRFIAHGSGMSFALGAMHAGADARTAVEAGIVFDQHSGGRVFSMVVDDPSQDYAIGVDWDQLTPALKPKPRIYWGKILKGVKR